LTKEGARVVQSLAMDRIPVKPSRFSMFSGFSIATHYNSLQLPAFTATHCNPLESFSKVASLNTTANSLQLTATYCSSLQLSATRWSLSQVSPLSQHHCSSLQLTATRCSVLQLTAICCNPHDSLSSVASLNTTQLTASHSTSLQLTATHCISL